MIYCPKCGTANRRGSRFCNECGEPLPMRTALRCPMCGTMNPVSNVYCDHCHARLLPLAAPGYAEPEPEPTSPVEPAPPAAPPQDWLAQLRASAAGEAEEAGTYPSATTGEPVEPVDLPPWLREMGTAAVEARPAPGETQPPGQTPAEEAERVQEAAPAEMPDWLREIAPAGAGLREEAAPQAVPEEQALAEIPDWLREIAPQQIAAPEPVPEEGPPAEAPPPEVAPEEPAPEIPGWLREIAPAGAGLREEAAPQAVPEEPALAEIPDWLREIAPQEKAAPEAAPEEAIAGAPPPTLAEIPGWLREIAPQEEAAPEAAPEEAIAGAPPPTLAEIPGWLREIAPQEIAAPGPAPEEGAPAEAAPPEMAPEEPAPAQVPDWLREVAPQDIAAPEPAPEKLAPVEIPDWLREIARPAARPESPPPPFPVLPQIGLAETEGLARADIPDWLEALRRMEHPPHPEAAGEAIETGPVETEGLLEGLGGLLTPSTSPLDLPGERLKEGPALAVETPAVRESAPLPTRGEASLARAQLLSSLLAQPAQVPQPEARPGISRRKALRTGERVQRWLVATALLLVTVGTLIAPAGTIPTLTRPAEPPTADGRIDYQRLTEMHDAVQGLNAGDDLLVAFEYGPPEADELNPVAEPILRHVLNQGARISVVSTRPEGTTIAERLLGGIIASDQRYTESQYTGAAYRTGNAAGVSRLLSEVGTRPALVLVLTAQPGPLRWWVEQTHALYGETLPVVVALSAALEPAASPYMDTHAGQLRGAVSGLSGAASYEALEKSAGQATQRLNSLAAGHITIAGLMILGAIFHALGDLRRRGE